MPKGADAATILAGTHEGTVQQKNLAAGAITSDAQIGNQVAVADLYPGDQLVKDRLAAQVETGVPADKVQISATLTAERAVGGTIKAGDTVGVYLSFEPFDTNRPETDTTTPAKTPNTTHMEFQHVLVTNVQSTTDPSSSDRRGRRAEGVVGGLHRDAGPHAGAVASASCSLRSSGTCGSRTSLRPSRRPARPSSPWATSTRW